jgi:rhodanese-related sulfurtransferase
MRSSWQHAPVARISARDTVDRMHAGQNAPPDITAIDALARVEAGAFLLDVREADEWQAGHAPQAVHIPMSELTGRTAEIPTDQTIICVCHVGGRSAVVADALNRAGWDALNLLGGMNAWESSGLPVV